MQFDFKELTPEPLERVDFLSGSRLRMSRLNLRFKQGMQQITNITSGLFVCTEESEVPEASFLKSKVRQGSSGTW